jgi:hypothetical protein
LYVILIGQLMWLERMNYNVSVQLRNYVLINGTNSPNYFIRIMLVILLNGIVYFTKISKIRDGNIVIKVIHIHWPRNRNIILIEWKQ